MRVQGDTMPFKAGHVFVVHQVDARLGHRLHDAALVGGRDHQLVLGRQQQIPARRAGVLPGYLVQKVGFAQVDDPQQGTGHLAMGIADGRRHVEHRCFQRLADHGATDG